jgi:hypothetical protein
MRVSITPESWRSQDHYESSQIGRSIKTASSTMGS